MPRVESLRKVRAKAAEEFRVELRKEPRRLRANLDCSKFFDVDVGSQTSPSNMDLREKRVTLRVLRVLNETVVGGGV